MGAFGQVQGRGWGFISSAPELEKQLGASAGLLSSSGFALRACNKFDTIQRPVGTLSGHSY